MTTRVCRFCGERFGLGRRSNQFHRAEMPEIENQLYCSSACRKNASRRRRRESSQGLADVARPLQTIENTGEILTKKTVLGRFEEARWIAGPRLTSSQLRCASLPLDPLTAETVRRANREAYTMAPYLPCAQIDWPRGDVVLSDWKSSGEGKDVPDIPEFLRR